tara:strand:- start:8521 stop:9138 length:618 start_codon:yes stop_codon:yes gene_type:complete
MMKKLLIFDLDGVLIDSKNNMKTSWESLSLKYNLNIPFNKYLNFIGLPFEEILKKLGIKKKFNIYKNYYNYVSKKNIHKIKTFPEVVKTLNIITKKKIKIAVVTSKDKSRTNKILKKLFKNIKFNLISSPKKKFRSKPSPDLLLNTISSLNVDPSESLYCGDMVYDLLTARRAGVMFVFAKYGYSSNLKTKHNIKNFPNILKYIK